MSGMNVIGLNTPNSYRLHGVTISNNEGRQWVITDEVDSFELIESIDSIFLKGSITIGENNNVFNRINFTGQEYIRLNFSGYETTDDDSEGKHINQVFRIFNVQNYVRDTQQDLSKVLYSLQFCSPLLYEAQTKRISRHFTGKSGQIIEKICTEYLNFDENNNDENSLKPRVKGGKELGNYFSVFEGDAGEVHGFLCPTWSVHKALKYLADHCSDDTQQPYGDSFYFFQTASGGFRFCNIGTMQNMVYRQLEGTAAEFAPRDGVEVYSNNPDAPESVGRDLLNYNKHNMYNTLISHKTGLYAAHILNYNTVTKQLTTIENEFTQQFEVDDDGLYTGNTIAALPPFRLGDENIRVPSESDGEGDGNPLPIAPVGLNADAIIKRYGAAINFDYTVPHTFSNVVEVGEGVSDSSISSGNALVKNNRDRVKTLFQTTQINVQIGGRTDLSCGMMINLNIQQPKLEGKPEEETTQNGLMLITDIKWRGDRGGLETHLTVASDGFLENNPLNLKSPEPERSDGLS